MRQHPGALFSRERSRVEGERFLPPDGHRHELDLPRHLGPVGKAGDSVSVDRGRRVRQEAVVIGHQRGEGAVAVEDGLLDEELGLQLHGVAHRPHDGRPLHVVIARGLQLGRDAEQWPKRAPRGRDAQHLVGTEPLVVEVDDGRPGLRVVQHPPRLPLDTRPRGQLAGRGRGEQLIVRHRIPEKVGETGRQLPRRRFAVRGIAPLDPEMERGRLQDAGDGQGDRLVDRAGREIGLPERREPFALVAGERTAPRPLGEPLDAGPGAVLLRGGGQGGPVGAVEEHRRQRSERREVHRREVQLLDLVGRRVLPLHDAFEAAGARFGRKPPGPDRGWRRGQEDPLARGAPRAEGIGEERPRRPVLAVPRKAEQVGDGVVVLGRGQRQRRCARYDVSPRPVRSLGSGNCRSRRAGPRARVSRRPSSRGSPGGDRDCRMAY